MKDKSSHLEYIGILLGFASWLLPSIPWLLKILISVIIVIGAYSLQNKANNTKPDPKKKFSYKSFSKAADDFAIKVFIVFSPILVSFAFFIFAGLLQIKQSYFGASTELTQLVTDFGSKMTWLHGLVVAMPIAAYGFISKLKLSKQMERSSPLVSLVLIPLGYQLFLVLLFYNSTSFFSDDLLFRLGVIFHPLIFVAPDLSVNNLLCNLIYIVEIGIVLLLNFLYIYIGSSIADAYKKKTEKGSEATETDT